MTARLHTAKLAMLGLLSAFFLSAHIVHMLYPLHRPDYSKSSWKFYNFLLAHVPTGMETGMFRFDNTQVGYVAVLFLKKGVWIEHTWEDDTPWIPKVGNNAWTKKPETFCSAGIDAVRIATLVMPIVPREEYAKTGQPYGDVRTVKEWGTAICK